MDALPLSYLGQGPISTRFFIFFSSSFDPIGNLWTVIMALPIYHFLCIVISRFCGLFKSDIFTMFKEDKRYFSDLHDNNRSLMILKNNRKDKTRFSWILLVHIWHSLPVERDNLLYYNYVSPAMRKCVLCHMRTTKAQSDQRLCCSLLR